MLVVSSREFREKQKSYLDKVDEGIEILIQRGKNRSYKIVPVGNDDTLMSKEEFFAKIDRAREQIKQGKCTTVHSIEELLEYLDSTGSASGQDTLQTSIASSTKLRGKA
jgi:antitoxin (DNA-binding transcriptional repressor) of toxin-antitoxin stability system